MNETTTILSECRMCSDQGFLTVRVSDLAMWQAGAMVQEAFPYLTPEQREFYFQSRICEDCQDTIFDSEPTMDKMTTEQMLLQFEVLGFGYGYCAVQRKSDGVKGVLSFDHHPRFYYNFQEV